MARQITITVEIGNDGEATIRLPEGKGQQRNANAAAAFTDQLSKAMGTVKERHIGDHHHHHDDHNHDHVTQGA